MTSHPQRPAPDWSASGQISPAQAGPPYRDEVGQSAADPELAGDERLAMLCYLGVPFLGFLVPLVIYLIKGRGSGFVRGQAAQALNLSITALLYTVCVLIVGSILALDTIGVALLIGVPLIAALWAATLCYVVRAAVAASRGDYFRVPAWICATLAR
jgi:uncharacterized Tic20 family protein